MTIEAHLVWEAWTGVHYSLYSFFVVARWFVIESNISSNSYRTVFWPFMKDKSERKILFFNFLFLFLAWIYLRLVYLYRYQTDCECPTKIHSHRPSKKPALTFIHFAKTVKHFSTKGVYFAFVTVAFQCCTISMICHQRHV